MDKQENQSKWDELARELGAEIPPESDRPKPPGVEDAGPAAPAEPPKPRPVPPKRAADWESLSSELGLPPAPSASKPIAREAPPPTRQAPAISEAEAAPLPAPAQRQRDADAASRRPPRRSPPQQDTAREAADRGRDRQGDRRDDRRRGRRGGRRDSGERDDTSEERDATRPSPTAKESVPPPQARPEPPGPEPPSKPASGVSLWQKIFGSPAEQSAKLVNATADDEVDQGAGGRRGPQRPAEREMAELPPEDASAAMGVAPRDATEDGDGFDEQAPAERKRRRSRRRRGRGRKPEEAQDGRRGSARDQDSQLMETPGADDFDDDFVDLGGEELDDTGFDAAPSFDDEADEADAGESRGRAGGDAAPAKARSASHRSIPSWEDAIGMIVESNMQTRSQRRTSSQSGPRGRSRGGKRRRKP